MAKYHFVAAVVLGFFSDFNGLGSGDQPVGYRDTSATHVE